MAFDSGYSARQPGAANDNEDFKSRLNHFLNPFDGRYEDLKKGQLALNVFRDFTAGLIVAMVAIPLAMGFAMASGLRPEQGIVGGAVAGLIGALFGGSKYQVYGPTAAFIPLIGGIMATYSYSFLVLASVISGGILCFMGLSGLGRLAKLVPHSIIVGFTIGIACVIATSQIGEVLGLKQSLGSSFLQKINTILSHLGDVNPYALAIAGITFVCTNYLLRVSVYIPAPLLAIGIGTLAASTIWSNKGLTLVQDKYGKIPTNFWVFTPPTLPTFNMALLGDLSYYVLAIVFVAAVESLLCSRMADRLANNRGIPFNPNKELWGQGMVNLLIPLLNGFPHTGALARTATNIKVGALSPLAGIFKCVLKLLLAAYLATYLEMVPMACIGGILLYVATSMVKPAEVAEVFAHNRFHIALMIWTAVVVLFSDFLTGVLSGLAIFAFVSLKFPPLNVQSPARTDRIAKLMNGVLQFRKRSLPTYKSTFERLALEQNPEALFITCCDSRIVPDLLISTKPGDLFVVRNVGNLVPPYRGNSSALPMGAEVAALDFALGQLGVKEIIIKGHSNCGAMKAVLSGGVESPALKEWLKNAEPTHARFSSRNYEACELSDIDALSQLNVIQQLEHLTSYPLVKDRMKERRLRLHGWWFDIKTATIFAYDPAERRFQVIDKKFLRWFTKQVSQRDLAIPSERVFTEEAFLESENENVTLV